MNIFKRIENNLKYAKYRKRREIALEEMQKHQDDKDSTVCLLWTLCYMEYVKKCIDLPLK